MENDSNLTYSAAPTLQDKDKGRLELILDVLNSLKIEGIQSQITISYNIKASVSNKSSSVVNETDSECQCGPGFCGPCSCGSGD